MCHTKDMCVCVCVWVTVYSSEMLLFGVRLKLIANKEWIRRQQNSNGKVCTASKFYKQVWERLYFNILQGSHLWVFLIMYSEYQDGGERERWRSGIEFMGYQSFFLHFAYYYVVEVKIYAFVGIRLTFSDVYCNNVTEISWIRCHSSARISFRIHFVLIPIFPCDAWHHNVKVPALMIMNIVW